MKAANEEREVSGLGRNVVELMKDRKLPTNVVELIPRGAIERMAPASEKTGARSYRLTRLVREQNKRQAATVACEEPSSEQLVDEVVLDVAKVEEKPVAVRDAGYPTPPAQIRALTGAHGSYLG